MQANKSVENERRRVLVVDDEDNVRESLRLILNRVYDVDVAASAESALEILSNKENSKIDISQTTVTPDLVLLDVMLPGLDGIELLRRLREDHPAIPVIMLTATNSVKSAVQAMKIGAVDYLAKPFDVDELLSLIEETLAFGASGRTSPSQVRAHKLGLRNQNVVGDYGVMVGQHPVMQEIYRKIEQLAPRDTTVLITGETGTGKELIAQEIHRHSARRDGPFIAVNCAAIPETLIESELFGHEKGAFTHAIEKRIGLCEQAEGGTLFLDEIGELSLPVQVKMLRFLQDQEFYRVGQSKSIRVNVRIIAATNKSLEKAVAEGRFRQDLYYRIHVVCIDTPPLRRRIEDIPKLVEHFIGVLSPMYGGRKIQFSDDAMQAMTKYSWPGNVRELENVIESILALSSEETIEPVNLPHRLRFGDGHGNLQEKVLDGQVAFEEAERAFETEIIVRALKKTNYVQTKAAELLGISRRILKYKMDKLGISDQASPQQSPNERNSGE